MMAQHRLTCRYLILTHSALIRNLIKLKGTAKQTAQDEQVCLKDSKYILFEILAHRTWKGRTSSCRPSKPNLTDSAGRSLYGPSMSYLLGFKTKYTGCNKKMASIKWDSIH